MMINKIRNSKWVKVLSVMISMQLVALFAAPQEAMALTGGPSQPEFSSFTPVGSSDMVDLFTGDFQYNIPLMDVGGYPLNLSYTPGSGMEAQSSNVGLGWRLNAGGEINRSMRGIPDDFNVTDKIIKRNNMKINFTTGANLTLTPEIIGKELDTPQLSVGLNFGVFFNSYKGLGYSFGVNPTIAIADGDKSSLNLGLGITSNSQSGVSINPRLSLDSKHSNTTDGETVGMASSLGFGGSYSSRAGLKAIAFDASIKSNKGAKVKDGNVTRERTLKEKGSGSIGVSIPIGMSTYVPNVGNAMSSSSLAADFGTGLELFWTNAKVRIGGYYNEQHLRDKILKFPASGYMYSGVGSSLKNSIQDFNREKDGVVNKHTPHVAMAQATYDIYNVTGQGVGGMYRPYRDGGSVADPYVHSISNGGSIGGDLGATNVAKLGLNFSYNYNSSSSGRWSSDNPSANLDYKKPVSATNQPNEYEVFYFKNAAEFNVVDENYLDKIGNLDPMRIAVTQTGNALPIFKRRTSLSSPLESNFPVTDLKRTQRAKRNQPMMVLTANTASIIGMEPQMTSHSFSNPGGGDGISQTNPISRLSSDRKPHHISEITINRNDGARYIYGNQQYNFKQIESSFNVDDNFADCATGFVNYNPNQDNTVKNKKGIEHFFSSTELPAYGTAYMLSSVVSADYVDLSGNGLTDDDLGNYTQFNYTRVYDKANPYKWRNPYGENKANFSEGYKSNQKDNRGNYVYGEKEIWEIHTITTKTHIAEFYYSPRKDAYDVKGENGGQGTNTLNKLDRIELYTKCDRELNGSNATALKKVHFEYDYSLCKGIEANNNGAASGSELANQGGKLTLKKVYFTYEDSKKGQLSPYQFFYADPDHDKIENPGYNPDYDFRGNDRWGNYKENLGGTSCNVGSGPLSTAEDPYVEQNKAVADKNTASWNLSTLQLPSGGIIKVDYESDDYAYVQDKRATRMFKVLGFAKIPNAPVGGLTTKLYQAVGAINNSYIYFDASEATTLAEFRKKYIGQGQDEIKNLFYKLLIDITGDNEHEYVPGYVSVDNTGFDPSTQMGWIKVKPVKIQDNGLGIHKIHPIAKTAMQFVRLNLPGKIFAGGDEQQIEPTMTFINFLISTIQDITQMLIGANRYLATIGYAKKVIPGKSFIRLQTPNYSKLGGGCRVAKIAINDNWASMSGNATTDFDYGQTYDYTTKLDGSQTGSNPDEIPISSGVAAYEPFIGNEENPLRQPVAYTEEAKLAPDRAFYQETPYGESFYPSPTVGYSKVKVTNLARAGVKRTATGYVQHEFYTAKDFPVKVKRPYTDKKIEKSGLLGQLFKINAKDNLTVSQSHVIELNDMHGKQKAQWVYAEDQSTPISGVKYFYKTQSSKHLSNQITTINKNGQVANNLRGGIEIDMINDERESKQFSLGVFIPTNIDISIIPTPIPITLPIPSAWPKVTTETTRYRSLSNTKVITRYGILERTEAYDLGSRVSTDNLAWDAETGQVLVTRTQNDFEDPIYSFTYPAHWSYDGMASSYKNIGLQAVLGSGSGVYSLTSGLGSFVPGDELLVNGAKSWVVAAVGNQITLQDINGNATVLSSGSNKIQVVRSGRRNQQSTPVGSVTTLTNPIQGTQLVFQEVLNAGAVEFKDEWPGFCECADLLSSNNPYVNGEKGNYRAQKSHLYLTERLQSDKNRNTNIRKDGTFQTFSPFWTPNSGYDWNKNAGPWTFTSEVTLVSPFGFEMENRDALNRYSAADYGYNNTLPTTVASNAQYKEIGFDNFEDYDCNSCPDDHFSFKESSPQITEEEAHTGRRSIKVSPGTKVELEKIIIPCQDVE